MTVSELRSAQWEFLQDVARLIDYAKAQGFQLTGGELWRTQEQQALHIQNKRSKTMNSKHLERLAIDLNIFYDVDEDGDMDLVTREEHVKTIAKVLGDYWERLRPPGKNVWGGSWGWDSPHFERRVL
jgi:hypothetical protein